MDKCIVQCFESVGCEYVFCSIDNVVRVGEFFADLVTVFIK